MKKFLVIFLLLVFVLHQVGYYFIYVSIKQYNESSFRTKLQNDGFEDDQLRKTTIPITLAYQPSQEHYQTVNEKLYINGEYYRVIKMKYARDTLHLLYIDDVTTQKLNSSLEKWISRVTENKSSDPQNNSIIQQIKNQYLICSNAFQLINDYVNIDLNTIYFNNYQSILRKVPHPPPKFLT